MLAIAGIDDRTKTKSVNSVPNMITTGLGAYWPLNEGTGTSTADQSGNGNTGTLTSSSGWLTTGCKYGNCYNFNGKYMSATTYNSPSFTTLHTNTFTISFWVNPSTTFTAYQRIISEDNYASGAHAGWLVLLSSSSFPNEVYLAVFNTAHTEYDSPFTTSLPTGSWSFVTFTFDGTNLCAYYNGASKGCNTFTGTILQTTYPLLIAGGDGNSPFAGYTSNIYLDDVRLYNSALSASQINSIYVGN